MLIQVTNSSFMCMGYSKYSDIMLGLELEFTDVRLVTVDHRAAVCK